jgi:hypothetical protein
LFACTNWFFVFSHNMLGLCFISLILTSLGARMILFKIIRILALLMKLRYSTLSFLLITVGIHTHIVLRINDFSFVFLFSSLIFTWNWGLTFSEESSRMWRNPCLQK